MQLSVIVLLVLLVFVVSTVGVVTGSNSLITVPVMFQLGIEPKVAVATNMFGLTFMSIGASIPFLREGKIKVKKLVPLILLTLIASGIGAVLVGVVSERMIPIIVSVGMIAVGIFTLVNKDLGIEGGTETTQSSLIATYVLTFILGIYGGLYSGGYVTILTAVFVAFFGMSFTESIASTKFVNVFSCFIATVIFAWNGLIDYTLGAILGLTMFGAAFIGAKFVIKLKETWLKRVFLGTVFILAIKTIFDYSL